MIEFMIRVPNFAQDFSSQLEIKKINVFSEFLNYAKKDRDQRCLFSFSEIDKNISVPRLFYKEELYYLRYQDKNNPWFNGFIRGSKSQLQRFLDDFIKLAVIKNDYLKNIRKVKTNSNVIINKKFYNSKIEYISPNKPHPFIIFDKDSEKSYSFESLESDVIVLEV